MNNPQLALEQARINMQHAEAEAAKARIEKARKDLVRARADARQLTKDIKTKRKEFAQALAEGEKPGERLALLNELIPSLACPEEFPTEKELQVVEDERQKLIAERDIILREGRALGVRIEAARDAIIVMEQRLERLRYTISNLEVVAQGGRVGAGAFEGYVRPVTQLPSL
jgi:chromosome segregation ATPase